jgi:hypothetical protein
MSDDTETPMEESPGAVPAEAPAPAPEAAQPETYTYTLFGVEAKAIMDLIAAQPTGSGFYPLLIKLDSQLQTQLMKK